MGTYYVYIVSNYTNTVLYIGVTNNLQRRLYEHQEKLVPWFTEKYNCNKLVYYEECSDIEMAIAREKQLKKRSRKKKDILIDSTNKESIDIASEWE